jgi:hypothetical protein
MMNSSLSHARSFDPWGRMCTSVGLVAISANHIDGIASHPVPV